MTRPPKGQFRAWLVELGRLHPSQVAGSPGGVIPYRRKTLSRHSWADRSVRSRVSGLAVSHAPVLQQRSRRRCNVRPFGRLASA
jgi:hypothetical protein